jgi:hypothetical protein
MPQLRGNEPILGLNKLTSGAENKEHDIIHGNHDSRWKYDELDRCYGTA